MTDTPKQDWHASDVLPPEGVAVLAEYHLWGDSANPVAQHVVWVWKGEWRVYGDQHGRAFVDRWQHLPISGHVAVRGLIRALREIGLAARLAASVCEDDDEAEPWRMIEDKCSDALAEWGERA